MKVTCGIFLIDNRNRLLVCHPTGEPKDKWSIPKGLPNEDESEKDAAIRELQEETGIKLKEYLGILKYLGEETYEFKPKILRAFCFFLNTTINQELKCLSIISGTTTPEVDSFKWLTLKEAIETIQPEQSNLLQFLILRYSAMKFDKLEKMRELIASKNNITDKTFNGYKFNDIEGYRKYLRNEFTEFIVEQNSNINNTENLKELLTEQGFIRLHYHFNTWKSNLSYVQEQNKTFETEHGSILDKKDILIVKQFHDEHIRYARKMKSLIERLLISVRDGVKEYKVFEKNAKVAHAYEEHEMNKDKLYQFQWTIDSSLREDLYKELLTNKLISHESSLTDFENVFYLDKEELSGNPKPYCIEWIDVARSGTYNRKSLVYMIQYLKDKKVIDFKKGDRNRIISFKFIDNKKNLLKDLKNVNLKIPPENASLIKKIIDGLIVLNAKKNR